METQRPSDGTQEPEADRDGAALRELEEELGALERELERVEAAADPGSDAAVGPER